MRRETEQKVGVLTDTQSAAVWAICDKRDNLVQSNLGGIGLRDNYDSAQFQLLFIATGLYILVHRLNRNPAKLDHLGARDLSLDSHRRCP